MASNKQNAKWPVYGEITGPIVMIGFGSIGRGTLPLIERHFKFDKSRMTVIDPRDTDRKLLDERGIAFVQEAVTKKNYKKLLTPLLTKGGGQGFCVNLSVDTSSVDLMKLCRKLGVLYVDTVVEPWLGFYFDDKADNAVAHQLRAARNAAGGKARQSRRHRPRSPPAAPIPAWCRGSSSRRWSTSPRTSAWSSRSPATDDREGWAKLMKKAGVKGIHIAERDTQRTKKPKPMNVFWNTWSVEGFISEGLQPAELGWGTHEKWMPKNAKKHKQGSKAAIYLEQPGANTRVRTWCPTPGAAIRLPRHAQRGDLDRRLSSPSATRRASVKYRPTCHYAYHPANDAVLSLHEMFGAAGKAQPVHHVLDENELVDGVDELGVLLYGHEKNAYWYGSQLSLEEARKLAPYQNATGLQVTSAVLAGMVWALENPSAGIVEADEMDYKRCLEVQMPYLGPVKGYYTDWTPLDGRPGPVPGGHRRQGPLAIPQHPRAVKHWHGHRYCRFALLSPPIRGMRIRGGPRRGCNMMTEHSRLVSIAAMAGLAAFAAGCTTSGSGPVREGAGAYVFRRRVDRAPTASRNRVLPAACSRRWRPRTAEAGRRQLCADRPAHCADHREIADPQHYI